MLTYPQLPTGALAQFPAQKRRQMRTLVNTAADGTAVKLADPGAATVEWQLKYASLTDSELGALLQFFAAAEGTLNSFTFVDPTANLLAWSSDLSNAVWEAASFLSLAGANTDPAGGNNAWQVSNSGRICVLPERVRKSIRGGKSDTITRKPAVPSIPQHRLATVCLHWNRGSDGIFDDIRYRVWARLGGPNIRFASGAAG